MKKEAVGDKGSAASGYVVSRKAERCSLLEDF
jgi:hypothetical protein